MEPSAEDTNAVVTLQVLEERLHRLEVLLHGSLHSIDTSHPTSVPATRDDTVSTRLTNIESGLHRLASRYGVVQDVLDLCMEV